MWVIGLMFLAIFFVAFARDRAYARRTRRLAYARRHGRLDERVYVTARMKRKTTVMRCDEEGRHPLKAWLVRHEY